MENGRAVEGYVRFNYEGESDPDTHGGGETETPSTPTDSEVAVEHEDTHGGGGGETKTPSTPTEVAVEHPTDPGGVETWRTASGDSKVTNNQMIRQSGAQIDIEFEENLPTFFSHNPLVRFIFEKLFLLDCFVEHYDMEITLKWRPKDEKNRMWFKFSPTQSIPSKLCNASSRSVCLKLLQVLVCFCNFL